ncbi:chromosomal replication initiator protein DnaA [Perlucidibaca aquatica]|uniref:chromosomal replication initiator protein DnaA n=1 Tax=Perlucidibaca aquatica TaxID=1852776 RepID=UPI00083A286F|nr:chromosomal replication initiator protein DnaA [Perlucidibaca aquatica]
MSVSVWGQVLSVLEGEFQSNLFQMWIRPLQVDESPDSLVLLAPNPFFVKHIQDKFLARIQALVLDISSGRIETVAIRVGSRGDRAAPSVVTRPPTNSGASGSAVVKPVVEPLPRPASSLNPLFTFDNFVAGKGAQLAHAGCLQAADNPGAPHSNPLFIYGPTGLGKTHLMHAVGNEILRRNPSARVMYLTSERFVGDFITALQRNMMNDFKRLYRSLDALLIDDIQFFAKKESTQDEFFHTFNSLLQESRQIIMTSDRIPKEINNMDDRLKSRFSWGLSIQVDPPDKETRVAILLKKSGSIGMGLPVESAHFIAEHVQGNVRELEGALNKVIATARFRGLPVTLDLVKEALRDLLLVRARQFNIDNIQRVVAEYYRINLRELTGKKRNRGFARPRQMAMALSRELTQNSYPEIGLAFDGRDHSTVIHACEKVRELRADEPQFDEDYNNLLRLLQA